MTSLLFHIIKNISYKYFHWTFLPHLASSKISKPGTQELFCWTIWHVMLLHVICTDDIIIMMIKVVTRKILILSKSWLVITSTYYALCIITTTTTRKKSSILLSSVDYVKWYISLDKYIFLNSVAVFLAPFVDEKLVLLLLVFHDVYFTSQQNRWAGN